ncbi:MAG: chromosome segregation protein SMC, partial [Planctomycetota bacterium]
QVNIASQTSPNTSNQQSSADASPPPTDEEAEITLSDDAAAALRTVRGLVAELFDTDVHVAPMIDAALGSRTQFAVVQGDALQNAIVAGDININGRVGLLRLDDLPPRRPGDKIRLDGLPGVVGRADRLVRCGESLRPLVVDLLGTTWLVQDLKTALGLRRLSGAGLQFVTAACEVLRSDGSVVVGKSDSAAGLVSRLSELASAASEIEHYEFQIRESESELQRLQQHLDDDEAEFGRAEDSHRQMVTERAAAAANLHHAQERLQTSSDDLTGVNEEVAANQQTLIAAKRNYNTASADFQHANQQIETLQAEIERATVQHANAQQQLQQTQADVMQINVEQARVEQKLDAANQTLATQTQRFTENDAAVSGMRDTLAREIGKMDTLRGRTLSLRLKIEQLRGGDAQFESEKQQLSGIVAEIRQSQSTHGAAMETVATALANAQQQLHQSTATIDSLQ